MNFNVFGSIVYEIGRMFWFKARKITVIFRVYVVLSVVLSAEFLKTNSKNGLQEPPKN
jgi:hypothetical protein